MTALAALDARIDRGPRLTLAADRLRPTSLVELSARLGERAVDAAALDAALLTVAAAQLKAFPKNLFWDLDALVASLTAQAMSHATPSARLAVLAQRVADLMTLFGSSTEIHFRYVHDFIYGFDWAKWVARAPAKRRSIGPFDESFLIYSERRARELLELIAKDDAKYRRLAPDEARNPFSFSREPDDEVCLYRDLAERELLPLCAWQLDPSPRWDRPFAALRRERAEALGLAAG